MEFIKKEMIRQGLNSAQLAKLSGYNRSTITRLFKGEIKSPSWDLIVVLCKVLDIKLELKVGNKKLIIK